MATGIRRAKGRSFRVWGLITGWLFLFSTGLAQVDPVSEATVADTRKILSETRTEIVEHRNTNQRIWQIVRQIETVNPTTQQAETEEVVSQVVEVGNGLCYQDTSKQWQVSNPIWRPTPDGFIMDTAGYKLEIGKTAGSWLRYTVQGDTTSLRASTILASDGFLSVTLSTLNPAIEGQIRRTDPSRLVFPQAFGTDIDLEIQAIPGGYHQNVIFNKKPSFPNQFDPEKTKVVIHTEIQTDHAIPASNFLVSMERTDPVRLTDLTQTVPTQGDIGIVKEEMVNGQIKRKEVCRFANSTVFENANGTDSKRVDASKSIQKLELTGSTLLVEELDRSFFEQARYPVVWDYQPVSISLTGANVWTANNTYYLSANITVGDSASLRIEPGTVVKFNSSVKLATSGTGIIQAQGSPYLRIIFTSKNDNYNGEVLTGISSGNPQRGDYQGIELGNSSTFEHCTVLYAYKGVLVKGELGLPIQHCYFYKFKKGIELQADALVADETLTIFNNLLVSDPCTIDPCDVVAINLESNPSGVDVRIYNNTMLRAYRGIVIASNTLHETIIENNIIAYCRTGIYAGTGFTAPITIDYNGYFGNVDADVNVPNKTGGSHSKWPTQSPFYYNSINAYYLNTTSDGGFELLNAGNVSPSTAGYTNPYNWAVHHPATKENIQTGDQRVFTTAKNYNNTAVLWEPKYDTCDVTGNVDLGYHHPRIDYIVQQVNVSFNNGSSLTIKPGAVIVQKDVLFTSNPDTYYGKVSLSGTLTCQGAPFDGGYITWVNYNRASTTGGGVPYSNSQPHLEMASGSTYKIQFTEFIGLGNAVTLRTGNGIFRDNRLLINSRGVDLIDCSNFQCGNNVFSANGISCRVENGSVTVNNCTFDRNAASINWAAASTSGSVNAVNCLFTNNTTGIRINGSQGSVSDHHNAFFSNVSGYSYVYNGTTVNVTYNGASTAPGFITPTGEDDLSLSGEPYDTLWTDFADRFHLAQASGVIDAGYDPSYEGMPFFTTDLDSAADIPPVDIGYHYPGVVRLVNPLTPASSQNQDGRSWATAYKYLQDALDEATATPITSICVAAGTYYPDEDKDNGHVNNIRTETFNLIEGMELYGGFFGDEDIYAFTLSNRDLETDKTILSGDIDKNGILDANNSYHVVTGADHTVMDGFTITKGYANDMSNNNYVGGGILNIDGNMIISQCIIRDNVGIWGGGMANFGVEQFPLIMIFNCAFQDNSAESGYTYGGAIFNGAVVPLIIDSQFENNQAFYGGAIADYQSLGMSIRCLFAENTAVLGGASYNGGMTGGNHEIINCVFYDNSATAGGGAFYCQEYDGIDIINSIFWQNSSSGGKIAYLEGSTSFPSVMSINYSDIENNTGCFAASGPYTLSVDNNIAADPLFADPAAGDFHLKSVVGRWGSSGWIADSVHSPCIDTGDPAMDYSLEPAFNGEQINMGIFGNTPYASKSRRGSLTVTIAPAGAISAGARWKLIYKSGETYYYYNNGAEYQSGDTISKLEPDTYWVEFTDINYEREYATPEVLPVSIGNVENKSITGTYAAVKWVSTSGSNSWPGTYQQPYRNIQYGIDNHGTNGTVIKVKGNNGQYVYYENITINGSDGYFRLEGYEWPKVNGGGVDSVMYLNQADDRVEISGFYITNGYAQKGAGIMIQSCSPLIENCRIYGNRARPTIQGFDWARGGGLAIESGAPRISGCDFVSNSAFHGSYGDTRTNECDAGSGGGVYTHNSNAYFEDCNLGVQVSWYSGPFPNNSDTWYESSFWIHVDEIYRVGYGDNNMPDFENCSIHNNITYWGTKNSISCY